MIVLRKMVAALLMIASLLVGTPYVYARQWKPEPWQMASEYCSIKHAPRPNEQIVLKWFASETNPPSQQAARETLKTYIIITLLHFKIESSGQTTFIDRPRPKVKLSDGTSLEPLKEDTITPAAQSWVKFMASSLSRALGAVGEHMNIYVFDGSHVSSCAEGVFWITYSGEEYEFRTPIPGCQ